MCAKASKKMGFDISANASGATEVLKEVKKHSPNINMPAVDITTSEGSLNMENSGADSIKPGTILINKDNYGCWHSTTFSYFCYPLNI